MSERLRIKTGKKICDYTNQNIDIIEFYKDIMDGDYLLTSYLTEVSCLKFRECVHNDCPLKSLCRPFKNHDIYIKE